MLEAEADVDAQSNDGGTALMLASQLGHPEVAKLLVEAEADVDAQDNDGFAALMAASQYGQLEASL